MINWKPDWLSLDHYPDPEKASAQEWAWEFLRRNQDYQKLYIEACDYWKLIENENLLKPDNQLLISSITGDQEGVDRILANYPVLQKGIEIRKKCEKTFSVLLNTIRWIPDPNECYDQALPCFLKRHIAMLYSVDKHHNYDIDEFSGSFYPITKKHVHRLVQLMNRKRYEDNPRYPVEIYKDHRKLLVEIALEGNIVDQISAIKELAQQKQEKLREWGVIGERKRKRKDIYIMYLRAYDAKIDENLSESEIAMVLLPNVDNSEPDFLASKNVVNYINRANELIYKDYIHIASKP